MALIWQFALMCVAIIVLFSLIFYFAGDLDFGLFATMVISELILGVVMYVLGCFA